MRHCLIAYDVGMDRTRATLARKLEKIGRRVQQSVFVVTASQAALCRLERELQVLLEERDRLLILPLCANCLASAIIYGPAPPRLIMA